MSNQEGFRFIDHLKDPRTFHLLRDILGEGNACYQRLCGDGVPRNLWIVPDNKAMSAVLQALLGQELPYKLYILDEGMEIVPLRKPHVPKVGSIKSLPRGKKAAPKSA
ncbi:MAG: hypothetical protein WCV82_03715 [Candidatus Paceibacterota bacterium]